MKKPQQLRQYLIDCTPDFQRNPERLQVFINAGSLQARLQANLHFEYQYQLQLIVTDLANHADSVLIPLLAWLKHNQTDLAESAVKFEAEILSNELVDLSITVPLSERVLVNESEQGYSAEHLGEPEAEYNLPAPALFLQLFTADELMTVNTDEPE